MGRAQFMSPYRLLAAADCILEALDGISKAHAEQPTPVDDPARHKGPRTRVFTQLEMNEAMVMLVRMGFIGPADVAQ